MGLETSERAKENAGVLRSALREVFMGASSRFSYRDVLNMSSTCTGHVFLVEVREFMEERFSKKLLQCAELAGTFEGIEVDVKTISLAKDSICRWISIVYGSLEHDLPASCSSDIFRAIQLLKTVAETLQSHTQAIDAMAKVLLPLDRKCYFMDRKMGFVERTYHKMLFRILRKCKRGMKSLLGLSLLASGIMLAHGNDLDGGDAFSRAIRYILHVLGRFGMKSRILLSTRNLVAEQDFHNLASERTDFKTVFNYFKEQRYIYPKRLHIRVERLVLARLYTDLDEACIVEKLGNAEDLEFILSLFVRGGIKSRLLRIYEKFIGRIASNFKEFHHIYTVNHRILETFDDSDFRNASRMFFEDFFGSKETCKNVSDFVDGLLQTPQDEDCDIVARITEESKDPEDFLRELQQRLSLRLLSGTSDLEREARLLRCFRRMHNENMLCMVNDCKSKEPSLLLMTMCKWPVFRTEDVTLPDSHPIAIFKRDVEGRLEKDKRRVSWTDSLSRVRFELFGRSLEASLFQYNVICKIIQQGTVVPRSQFHMHTKETAPESVVSTVKIRKNGMKVPKCYAKQFSPLLENVLLQSGEFFVLNPCLTGPIGASYEFQKCTDEFEQDCSFSAKAFYEASICRVLKRTKEMELEELQEAVGDIGLDEMKEYLTDLEKKGFLEVTTSKIVYCP